MDDQRSPLWVERLVDVLEARLTLEDSPRNDLEWLLLRCRDTLGLDGDIQTASLRQLKADVAQFVLEFPGQVPADLVPPNEDER